MQSTLDGKIHIGIIMDGNGRWAAQRGLDPVAGHEAGIEALRRVVRAAPDLGVGILTLYAFSSDNWQRPREEVTALMALLHRYLDRETEGLVEDGVRLSVIGRRDRLPGALAAEIARAEAATEWGDALRLRIAIDYSARAAILAAATLLSVAVPDGKPLHTFPGTAPATRPDYDDTDFAALVTGERDIADVDLVIRTSGEQRLSDFLLWESAYAELYFTPTLWPDFTQGDLAAALAEFRARTRRFGRRGAPAAAIPAPEPAR